MTPPVRNPPCPSCEGFNRLAGDEAALADLDRVAGETRAPSANEAPRPASARPAETSSPNTRPPNADSPSPRGTEARPRLETAREAPRSPAGSETRAGERTTYTGQAPRSEFARPSAPQNLGIFSAAPTQAGRESVVSRRAAETNNAVPRNQENRLPPSTASSRETVSSTRSFSASPTTNREGQISPRGEASLFAGGVGKSLAAGFSQEIFGTRVLQGALGAATEAFLGSIFSGNSSAIPMGKIPVVLQGLITALQANPAMGTAVLQQGLVQMSLNPAFLNQLNPAQRQALQNLMAASGLVQTKLNNGAFPPLAFPSLTASRNLPGLMQRMEVSALKFASLLSADYLSKKRAEKSDEESAWLDKLGLFIRRKSSDKKDRKKLSEAARRFLERIKRKQDAQWEDRREVPTSPPFTLRRAIP